MTPASTAPALRQSHIDLRKPRLLLVDDEPAVLRGVQRVLAHGQPLWEISIAHNGAEALSAMAERPADVVVTDLQMPVMGGARLLQELASRHPGTIRVVHSSHIDTTYAEVRKLAFDVILKPAPAMTILTALANALNSSAWSQRTATSLDAASFR